MFKVFKYESADCSIIFLNKNTAKLSSVYSRKRQQGHASGLMELVCAYADTNDINLYLRAKRYGYTDNIALDNLQLVEFYKKYGFVIVSKRDRQMYRKANSQE